MAEKKNKDFVEILTGNLLAVSIFVSALIMAGTMVYVFGGGSGSPSGILGGNPLGGGSGNNIPLAGDNPLSIDNLKTIARAVGVDGDEFDTCLDSGKHAGGVSSDAAYGASVGVNGTPSFFVNGTPVVGAVPFEQLASVIDDALSGNTNNQTVTIDVGDSPVLGDPNAPVTLVEFSDYECPFCGRFFSSTLPSVKSQYIDSGQVKLVYKDFPLTSIHPNAQKAAEAARCVRDQLGDEGYWEIHDQMFSALSA